MNEDELVNKTEKLEDIKQTTKRKIGLICQICGKDCKKSVKKFGLHMRTHNPLDPTPYKCTHCDERFSNKKKARAHINLEHEEPKRERIQFNSNKKLVTEQTIPAIYGLTQQCRICLNELVLYANLKHEIHHDIFIQCTGIDVFECPPEIPTCICFFCERTLLVFYNFQTICWESDLSLRVTNIKTAQEI